MNTITIVTEAVLNSLWQAVILVFLVWLATKLLQRRVNAVTRHIIWWVALTAIIILPSIPRSRTSVRTGQQSRLHASAAVVQILVAAPLAAQTQQAPITILSERSAVWPLWVLAFWMVVFAGQILRIAGSYRYIRSVKSRAVVWTRPLPDVARAARLLLSRDVSSPVAIGFLHPAVIIPENLREELTAEEMDCVILHELAHLTRYDDWSNLAARVLGALLTLHPLIWWILRQIDREREIACDDWVVARTGFVRSYAQSLVRIVELRAERADSVLVCGVLSRRSRLRDRIEMLLRRGRQFSPVLAWMPVSAVALALIGLAMAAALAPHWIVFAQRPEFEVASVKRNTTNGPVESIPRRSGDLVMFHNAQPYTLIYYAYHLNGAYQMVGYARLPEGWNWYDIDARVGTAATEDQVRLMFQSLLADRFKLQIHREAREIPEYELTIVKDKSKVQLSREGPMTITIEDRKYTQSPGTCGTSLWREGSHLVCHAVAMEKIAAQVSGLLHAPVVDRTGLTGTYDLNVRYVPDNRQLDADMEPGPTLQEALREELGLKLQRTAGPVEVIVVDHMEKPSEN